MVTGEARMQRWRGLEEVPDGRGRCVVAIGVFDGVHRGHRRTIGRAVERARDAGLPSVVVTFDPHPRAVVGRGGHPPVLTTHDHRADLVSDLGVDAYCVLPFTPDFARLSPQEFVTSVLVEGLRADAVVVGENFRFGSRAAGDVGTLREHGERAGFAVEAMRLLGDDGMTCSSTYVRSRLDAGDIPEVVRALGRDHAIEGTVSGGPTRADGDGRLALQIEPSPHSAVPSGGVYAGRLVRCDAALPPGREQADRAGGMGNVRGASVPVTVRVTDGLPMAQRRVEVRLPSAVGAAGSQPDLRGWRVRVTFQA